MIINKIYYKSLLSSYIGPNLECRVFVPIKTLDFFSSIKYIQLMREDDYIMT